MLCDPYYAEKKKIVEIPNASVFIWHAKAVSKITEWTILNISDYEFSLIRFKTWTKINFNLYENPVSKFKDKPDARYQIYS